MSSQEHDMNPEKEMQLVRAKILGALIRETRLDSGKSLSDCANFLDLSEDLLEKFELGEEAPSLPQLELIAYFLEVPPDRFLSRRTTEEHSGQKDIYHSSRVVLIRDRIIGAMVRLARVERKLSIDELCLRTAILPAEIEAMELGKKPITVPQLESIARTLNLSIRDFQDKEGITGKRILQLQAEKDFRQLPLELQVFFSTPENLPYLELAKRLSEISAERLRSIAEGILEITY